MPLQMSYKVYHKCHLIKFYKSYYVHTGLCVRKNFGFHKNYFVDPMLT